MLATPGRCRGWGEPALTAAGFAGLVAAEAAVAFAIGGAGTRAVVGVLVLLSAGTFCLLAPRIALLSIAAAWGVLHTVLLDFKLVDVGSVQLTLSRALGVVIVLFLGLSVVGLIVTGRGRHPRLPLPLRALFAFLLLFAADALVTASSAALSDVVRVASGVVLGLAAYYVIDTPGRLARLLTVVTYCGTVVGAVTSLQFALSKAAPGLAESLFGSSFYSTSFAHGAAGGAFATRVHGPLGSPDETGVFLLVTLAFALLRYTCRAEVADRRRAQLPILVIALGMFSTLTRTAVAGSLVLLLAWAFQRQIKSSAVVAARTRILGLISVVAVVGASFAGASTLSSRVADINPTGGAGFAQGRGSIWAHEIAALKSGGPVRLVTGHGVHASYVIGGDSPHNIAIWLLVETGLIGLAVYGVFAFALARTYFRQARARRFTLLGKAAALGFALVLAYLVVDSFVLTPPSSGNRWYFMLFVGATMRALAGFAGGEEAES